MCTSNSMRLLAAFRRQTLGQPVWSRRGPVAGGRCATRCRQPAMHARGTGYRWPASSSCLPNTHRNSWLEGVHYTKHVKLIDIDNNIMIIYNTTKVFWTQHCNLCHVQVFPIYLYRWIYTMGCNSPFRSMVKMGGLPHLNLWTAPLLHQTKYRNGVFNCSPFQPLYLSTALLLPQTKMQEQIFQFLYHPPVAVWAWRTCSSHSKRRRKKERIWL